MHARARASRRRPRGPPPVWANTSSPCVRRVAGLAGLAMWSSEWMPTAVRGALAVITMACGMRDGVGSLARAALPTKWAIAPASSCLARIASAGSNASDGRGANRPSPPAQTSGRSSFWKCPEDIAVIAAGDLGFAGASEPDQMRWLMAFRRLLDGLGLAAAGRNSRPARDANLTSARRLRCRATLTRCARRTFGSRDRIGDLETTSRRSVTFATDRLHVRRLESALRGTSA